MDEIIAERARALYEVVARRPALLNTLRGMKVTLDVGTTGLVVASHGLDWSDAVIGPLVAPLQRLILEWGLRSYFDVEQTRLKEQQMRAFREVIDSRMVGPIRDLFQGAARPDEIRQARVDLETVVDALGLRKGAAR